MNTASTKHITLAGETAEDAFKLAKISGFTTMVERDGEHMFVGRSADGKKPRLNQIKQMECLAETMKTKNHVRKGLGAKLLMKKVEAFLENPSPEALTEAVALTEKVLPLERNPTAYFLLMVKVYGEKCLKDDEAGEKSKE